MKGSFPIHKLKGTETPFYFYNTGLLRETLETAKKEAGKYGYNIHYAMKANANPRLLSIIREQGLGSDCVSGGEVLAALKAGFPASKVVFAGVGKADWEINVGLENDIFCFNVESIPELEVINELAAAKNKVASIAIRVNPNVDAHTHHYITTGLQENKFGINLCDLDTIIDRAIALPNIKLVGLHFHIGSQITDMTTFASLSMRINEIQTKLGERKIRLEHINVGGGLGIDYDHPNRQPIPDFKSYFETFHKHLNLYEGQTFHCELGRSLVAQCGSLISKVLYIKQGTAKQFAILDAGMTDLIRPALYQAYHKIENLSSEEPLEKYDVVGPICESSDCFEKEADLNKAHRGDYVALRSAGAYGEIMASQYNLRRLPGSFLTEDFI
ncbi:MAG TPA: diaminopimelate decarboxylase [Bacteroidales bacterium]